MTNTEPIFGEQEFFEPIAQRVSRRFGLAATPRSRARLLQAVKIRMAALGGLKLTEYDAVLRLDDREWPFLWPALAPPGNGFFNHPAQFELLADFLDEWSLKVEERTLNILCLGCDGGFDLHSLAMILGSSGLIAKGWEIALYGADLNPNSVLKAQNGLYTGEEISFLDPRLLKKWFTPRAGKWWFKADQSCLKGLSQTNIYDLETWPWPEQEGAFKVVWARGQTFEAAPWATRSLANSVRRLLAPGGVLFTAPGEVWADNSEHFTPELRSGQVYFRHQEEAKSRANPGYVSKKALKQAARAEEREQLLGPKTPGFRAQGLFLAAAEKLCENPEEARDLLLEALDDTQSHRIFVPEAWSLMALIDEALKRPEVAALTALLAVGLAPEALYPRLIAAKILTDQGRILEARLLEEIGEREPKLPAAKWAPPVFRVLGF